jgi:sigma-B regulation protein RsbU (phosphoserine phosphatase)
MPHEVMQCMEVWGGNQVADRAVTVPGLDAWVYSKPHGESDLGGDVYYVSACATGRITRILIADVAGHGAGVADIAVSLRSLMRRFVNYIDQSRFVKSMNEQFTAMSKANCFATAIVATYFSPTGEISLCNAGHPPPLLYRAKEKKWSLLVERDETRSAGNIPLGILDMTDYEHFDIGLEIGDQILCYTDALMESRDAKGEMLGTEGLVNVANGLAPVDDGKAVMSGLLGAIAALHPGNLSEDDVTVMLFRANGKALRTTFFTRAAAPLRVLAALIRSPFTGERVPLPEFSLANLGGAMFYSLSKRAKKSR